MIKLQDMTPKVYYNQSRDFQFIGRLYDLVLNYIKTNSDLIYSIPLSIDSDEKFIELASMTLGFSSKHRYNVKQLTALCTAFCEIIRNKGNKLAIDKAVKALCGAEGLTNTPAVSIQPDKNLVTIWVSPELSDTTLLNDLMTYILPAGMHYRIIKNYVVVPGTVSTSVTNSDKAAMYQEKQQNIPFVPQIGTGASRAVTPRKKATGEYAPISGVYVNSVVYDASANDSINSTVAKQNKE